MRSGMSFAAAVSLVPVLAFSTPASAELESSLQRTNNVSTASWSVSPAVKGGAAKSYPLVLDWVESQNIAYSYFDGVNTGSTQVTKTTFSATSVSSASNPGNSGNSGNSNNSSVSFEFCDGGEWDTVDHSCSGNVVAIGSYSGANSLDQEIMQILEVGERIGLRAVTPKNATDDLETSISFSVSRSSVRGPVGVNS